MTDIEGQVAAALNDVAVVDRSFYGRISLTGADSLDLLHRLSTNDLASLSPGKSIQTIFLTDKGRIVDSVRLIVRPHDLLLITSPQQESKVKTWIEKYTIMEDIRSQIVTRETEMFSIIGPHSASTANRVFGAIPEPGANSSAQVDGVNILLDYQKEPDFDCINVVSETGHPVSLGSTVVRALNDPAVITAEAYDCIRIMSGSPSSQAEFTECFNPLELGLRQSISFTKGCYVGQEIIARLDTYQKIQKCIALFALDELPELTSPELTIRHRDQVGILTSVARVPYRSKYFSLGVVKLGTIHEGDLIELGSQPTGIKGLVVKIFDASRTIEN